MDSDDSFEEDDVASLQTNDSLLLSLDGFDGPIDLLLSLARDQKVDLHKISILALADQYLDYIHRARVLRLEIAADYLVMAAWLAYLKSRLLIPAQPTDEEEENPAELAARLAFQLQRLEAMQKSSQKLMERFQLGQDFFRRGEPETTRVEKQSVFELSLYELLRAYGHIQDKKTASLLRIMPTELYSMDDAIERLRGLVGQVPNWQTLQDFLPEDLKNPLVIRSAMAAHFAASLELVREGLLEIRQNGMFEPIFLRPSEGDETVATQGEEGEDPQLQADNDNNNVGSD
ncbi:segregation and condensation protein A [Aestuariispira insulae]|uniref:Segregation and condensation protein A n=1 Tax=Aestuariispira insulae TaxID=1461337 RepID=A0A3D9HNG5_9PROT|nr:ScpA family protein [Aestuariispira insulae]RED51034.1 condensin subunit ScpA [Aestuariispira insulae]